jgi:hypothetical protein
MLLGIVFPIGNIFIGFLFPMWNMFREIDAKWLEWRPPAIVRELSVEPTVARRPSTAFNPFLKFSTARLGDHVVAGHEISSRHLSSYLQFWPQGS